MKTAQLKSIILAILITSLSLLSYAQTDSKTIVDMHGIELSQEIYSYFTKKGFSVEQQGLLPSDSSSFPQNLIINISAKNQINSNRNWNDSTVDSIIFDLPQELAKTDLEALEFLMQKIQNSDFSYNAIFLLSANDRIPFLTGIDSDNTKHPGGTKIYTRELGYDNKCAAIVLSQKTGDNSSIYPGSGKNVAPLWLVRTIYEKMIQSGTPPSNLPAFFSLLYTLDLALDNQEIDSFMDMGIPAAGITIEPSKKDYEMIYSIAEELSPLHKENWDRNYLFFTLGGKNFWIPEAATIALFLFAIGLVLLFVCFTGVLPTAKSTALLKDIKRSWFIFPIIVALTALLLHTAQSIFSYLAASNPLLLISLKIFVAFIIIFLLFIIQTSFNLVTSIRAFGFLMTASATLNIFIFSGTNLTLMYFFVAEFFMFLISERVKTTPMLIITLLLTLFPFLNLLGTITAHIDAGKVSNFAIFSWTRDMFFALLLFPVMMQLERLFVSTDLLSPNKKLRIKNYIITSVCSEAVLIATLWGIYGHTSMQIKKSSQKKSQQAILKIKDVHFPTVSATISEQEFMELSMRTLTLKSKDFVMRYEISIETEEGVPIFESNYNYVLEAKNKVSFVIPDFPSGDLDIIYSADSNKKSVIKVQAYIFSTEEQNTILRETVEIETKALPSYNGDSING